MKEMYLLEGSRVNDIDICEINFHIHQFIEREHIFIKRLLGLYVSKELYLRLHYLGYVTSDGELSTLFGTPIYIDGKLNFNEIRIERRNDSMGVEFSGFTRMYLTDEKKLPDKVQFNKKKKATTLIFDDDVVVVKQNKKDKEDYEKAFLWAYFIKKSGLSKTKASKYIDKVMEELK